MITPEEFAKAMLDIRDKCGKDVEQCHSLMDELMCSVLKENGYEVGVFIFEHTDKWYS